MYERVGNKPKSDKTLSLKMVKKKRKYLFHKQNADSEEEKVENIEKSST